MKSPALSEMDWEARLRGLSTSLRSASRPPHRFTRDMSL